VNEEEINECVCGHQWFGGEDCPRCATKGDSLVPEPLECQQKWACLGCHKCNPSDYPYPDDASRRRDTPSMEATPPGREGWDYCTHDAEPDYCDGCLCIRQKADGAMRTRVKEATEYIDTLLDRTAHDHLFLTIRAILTGEKL
jgi:hypothetical protein